MSVEFGPSSAKREEFAPTIFLLQELTGAIKGGLRIKEEDVLQRLYFWRLSNSYGLVYLNGKNSAFKLQINERGVKEVGVFKGNSKKDLKPVYTIHMDHSVAGLSKTELIAGEDIKQHWDAAATKLLHKFVSSFLDGKAEIFAPEAR